MTVEQPWIGMLRSFLMMVAAVIVAVFIVLFLLTLGGRSQDATQEQMDTVLCLLLIPEEERFERLVECQRNAEPDELSRSVEQALIERR